jgi:hypothetical protein
MSTVFVSAEAHSLKKTLNAIIDDPMDIQGKLVMKRWIDEEDMTDAFEDDLEMSGIGLLEEVPEGSELPTGTIQEGYVTRYIARKFGKKIVVTEEALDDGKYKEVIRAGQRLLRACWKTVDMDATNILIRMFNSTYVGGDNVCLANASHTIPTGAIFSNTMATPIAASRAGFIIATTSIRKMLGHDGTIEGYEPEKILCPLDQWADWKEVVGSTHAPEAGEFNRINVVNDLMSQESVVPIKYWSNTSTNWAIKTSADRGVIFKWRKRPNSKTWVNNDQELMNYSVSARWARGWSDPRGIYGVQA